MPQYYKVLDNGQEKGSGSQKAENKRFNSSRPRKNPYRRADGTSKAGDWEKAYATDRKSQNAHKKVVNQVRASRAAAKPTRKKWNSVDGSYIGQTIFNAKERKAKQGKKR